MIIHNYEVQTGHVVSMSELESGYLKGRLHPKDYNIKQRVSQYKRHNLPMGLLLRVPFRRAHSHTYPERVLNSSTHALFFIFSPGN